MPAMWNQRSRSTTRQDVVPAVMLGLATGMLSQSGTATVLAATPADRLPGFLRAPWVRRLAVAWAVGEILANAFVPFLPPRTTPGPLGGRIVQGAATAALLAHADQRPMAIPAIAGGGAAALSANVATRLRARLSRHIPDLLIAIAETVLSLGLARGATRR